MKQQDMRIVFMGTPKFSVSILESILRANYKVVGVITAPDRPAGRGQKIHESAVKLFSKSKIISARKDSPIPAVSKVLWPTWLEII